jgi:ATP-binding protein involved in chromosome partitioning
MPITVEQIEDALKNVNHPSTSTDIVTLKMVHNISIDGNNIAFTLIYNKPNDPFASSIKKACNKVIEGIFGKQIKLTIKDEFAARKTSSEFETLEKVKNIIAITSGKGGVGKSTVAVNLAIAVAHTGAKVALLDADVYGPSIPIMFGAEDFQPDMTTENGKELIVPLEKFGIKIQSVGFFFKPDEALIWRGPMATNALKQIIAQTAWGELDYLFIDSPPGTGDIHLTLVQEMRVAGAIVVSTPQNLALADVIKAINMFKSDKINVPLLGIVENMAWFTPAELPENKYYIFGKEGSKHLAEKLSIPLLGQIPIVQSICEDSDNGKPTAINPFTIEGKAFATLAENVIAGIEKRNATLPPTKKVEITHQ